MCNIRVGVSDPSKDEIKIHEMLYCVQPSNRTRHQLQAVLQADITLAATDTGHTDAPLCNTTCRHGAYRDPISAKCQERRIRKAKLHLQIMAFGCS